MFSAALRLIHSEQVSLMRLVDAMSTRPAQIFRLPGGTLKVGAAADIAIADLDMPWIVALDKLSSRSKNSPFEDARFSGRVTETWVGGKKVFSL